MTKNIKEPPLEKLGFVSSEDSDKSGLSSLSSCHIAVLCLLLYSHY